MSLPGIHTFNRYRTMKWTRSQSVSSQAITRTRASSPSWTNPTPFYAANRVLPPQSDCMKEASGWQFAFVSPKRNFREAATHISD